MKRNCTAIIDVLQGITCLPVHSSEAEKNVHEGKNGMTTEGNMEGAV